MLQRNFSYLGNGDMEDFLFILLVTNFEDLHEEAHMMVVLVRKEIFV